MIGASILFAPQAFIATNHITLGADPNLMSETRAPGGLVLAAGIVMLCRTLMLRLLRIALVTGAVVFGMYGVSCLVSPVA